tara:strand:- start:4442 stop:5176 length:735 start_codon:yes stop_codon:yes gene_type:complete
MRKSSENIWETIKMSINRRNRALELAGISHRSSILSEGEDEDLFGGDEEDDAPADDAEEKDEETGDDEGGDAEAEEKEEKEPEEKVSTKDIAKYGPGEIDSEIDSILKDIYDSSVKSAQTKAATSISYPGSNEEIDDVQEASYKKYSMKRLLLEEEAIASDEFNIEHFTSEVARYINNYETLLDMEGMLFNKARQFLLNQFGGEMESDFIQKLALEYSLDFENSYIEDETVPVAVGGNAEAAPS